jgi:hypothetical protein
MNWKAIRLELARTNDFPNGSASRAYLMRLPLLDDGAIDECALKQAPEQATVRRLWPSEPDLSGHLVRAGTGWAFMAGRNGTGRIVAEIDPRPISEGGLLTLREQGQELPFRVAQLRTLS